MQVKVVGHYGGTNDPDGDKKCLIVHHLVRRKGGNKSLYHFREVGFGQNDFNQE